MAKESYGSDYKDKPTYDWQCTWETGEYRCRMPAGGTTDGYRHCSWHNQAQNWLRDTVMKRKVGDIRAFSEWIQAIRSTYGFFSTTVDQCKFTIESLWDAVRGVPGQLRVEPQWSAANDITFTKELTNESTKDYQKLLGKILKGNLSPIEWRAETAKLDEKHGVKRAMPPLVEGGGGDVFIPLETEEQGQTEAEASEERQRQQVAARQMGLDIDGGIPEASTRDFNEDEEVPF